jgi:hypothetical protein
MTTPAVHDAPTIDCPEPLVTMVLFPARVRSNEQLIVVAVGGNASTSSTDEILSSDFVVRLSGMPGLKYSGSYMTVTASGNSKSLSVDGYAPPEYRVSGSIVSTTFQKQAKGGQLSVEIVKGGQVVSQSETSAAYGVVAVATQ